MRRKLSTLAIPLLALGLSACTGDPEPELEPTAPTAADGLRRTFAPPTASQVAAYEQELAQTFAKPTSPIARATAAGVVADATGHAHVALAVVDLEGGIETNCVDDPQQALQFLTRAAAASAQIEEK